MPRAPAVASRYSGIRSSGIPRPSMRITTARQFHCLPGASCLVFTCQRYPWPSASPLATPPIPGPSASPAGAQRHRAPSTLTPRAAFARARPAPSRPSRPQVLGRQQEDFLQNSRILPPDHSVLRAQNTHLRRAACGRDPFCRPERLSRGRLARWGLVTPRVSRRSVRVRQETSYPEMLASAETPHCI